MYLIDLSRYVSRFTNATVIKYDPVQRNLFSHFITLIDIDADHFISATAWKYDLSR